MNNALKIETYTREKNCKEQKRIQEPQFKLNKHKLQMEPWINQYEMNSS